MKPEANRKTLNCDWADRELNSGDSDVIVHGQIPCGCMNQPRLGPREAQDGGGSMNCSKKILIVDDSDFAHNVYRVVFGFMNLSILSVRNGSGALEMISKESDIALVILDLNMSSMNGLELLKMLSPRFKRETPIIVVSSEKDKVKQQMALQCGAVQFFEKSRIDELKQFSKHLLDNPHVSSFPDQAGS
jgi:CheY-like chemotaxis protein